MLSHLTGLEESNDRITILDPSPGFLQAKMLIILLLMTLKRDYVSFSFADSDCDSNRHVFSFDDLDSTRSSSRTLISHLGWEQDISEVFQDLQHLYLFLRYQQYFIRNSR